MSYELPQSRPDGEWVENYREENGDLHVLRLIIGLACVAAWTALSGATYYARQTIKETASVLRLAAISLGCYAVYWVLTEGLVVVASFGIDQMVAYIEEQDTLSERAAAAIGVAVLLVSVYALYRVVAWSLEPYKEKLERMRRQAEMQRTLQESIGIDPVTDGGEDEDTGFEWHDINENNGDDGIDVIR